MENATIKAFGIDVAADGCVISDNILLQFSRVRWHLGERRNAVVERNQLRSMLKEAGTVRPIALLLAKLGANGSLWLSRGGCREIFSRGQDGIVVIGNEGAEPR